MTAFNAKGTIHMRHSMDRRTLLKVSAAGIGATVLLPGVAAASELPAVPGMLGDRKANEFWYQFDQTTKFAATQETLDVYTAIQAHLGGSLVQTFRDKSLDMSASPDYPYNFTS